MVGVRDDSGFCGVDGGLGGVFRGRFQGCVGVAMSVQLMMPDATKPSAIARGFAQRWTRLIGPGVFTSLLVAKMEQDVTAIEEHTRDLAELACARAKCCWCTGSSPEYHALERAWMHFEVETWYELGKKVESSKFVECRAGEIHEMRRVRKFAPRHEGAVRRRTAR